MSKEKTNVPGSSGNASRKVEVFRPGTFKAMNGQEYTFTDTDVSEMASHYDADKYPAPVVVGHPKHDDPAFGWAEGFEVNANGTLVATLSKLAPEFVSAVEDGRYRKVSMKFYPPDAPNNPAPGNYYPRHIGFLGGAAPAVSGLAPVQFTDSDDDQLVEIAFSLNDVAESTSSLMRSLREFLIEKFSLEDADKAVPAYHIRWIEAAADVPEDNTPNFSDPQKKEPSMSKEDKAKLDAREAKLAKRERALQHTENVGFADGLIDGGKLLPVQKDSVVALLDELGANAGTEIEFSNDGTDKTAAPADLLKDVLSAQPQIVDMGQTDLGDEPTVRAISFAAPDGFDVDADDLALHNKAVAFQSKNPGTEYLVAVAAVEEA